MEYWRNAFEGRGLLFYDHTELQGVDDDDYTSNVTNPSKSVHDWDDMKPLSDFDRNISNPNDLDLPESVFRDILANSVSSEPSLGCLATEISNDSSKPVSSVPVQSEFGSKSSKGKLPCPTELKFEGLAYSGELKIHKILKDNPNSKKARNDDNPCTPVYACQVHGCDRDLRPFKEYYRRHKVCDIHSKTPLVLINGIEKRFCQQCSRFHLMSEFDDGKRSCRKRLAGHNARRRKAAVVTDYAKSNHFLQFCQGSQKNGGEESMSMYSKASRALSLLSAEEWQSLSSRSRSSACIPTSVPLGMQPLDQNPNHRWMYHQPSSSSSAAVVAHEQQSLIGSSSTGSYFDRLGTRMVPESYNGGVGDIGLNQLSAHLQRVEQQRNYVLMKPENYLFR